MHNDVVDREVERKIQQLNYQYVQCLDDDRLEEWPGLFVQDCRYLIHPRENFKAGLEGYWLYFENNAMLRDRVTSLREANLFNIHQDRHIVSAITITGVEQGVYHCRASYVIVQTDVEGHPKIFSVGEYRDQVVAEGDGMKFKERQVIVDNFNLNGLVATPF